MAKQSDNFTGCDVTTACYIASYNIIAYTQCGAFYLALSQNCEKRLLASSCLPVRMEQLGPPLKGFT
jgi:ribosomal silencing factor RsfS